MLFKIVIGLVVLSVHGGVSAVTLTPEAAKKYRETGVFPQDAIEMARSLADKAEHHMRTGAARPFSWWKDTQVHGKEPVIGGVAAVAGDVAQRKLDLTNKQKGAVLEKPKAFNIFYGKLWTKAQRDVLDNLATNLGKTDYDLISASWKSPDGVAPGRLEFAGSAWDQADPFLLTSGSGKSNSVDNFLATTFQKYADARSIANPGDFNIFDSTKFDLDNTVFHLNLGPGFTFDSAPSYAGYHTTITVEKRASPTPTPAPTTPGMCAANCFGQTCNFWARWYACETLTNTYGCACSPTSGCCSSQTGKNMISIVIAINLYGKYKDSDPQGLQGTTYSSDFYTFSFPTSKVFYYGQNPMSSTLAPSVAPSKAPTTAGGGCPTTSKYYCAVPSTTPGGSPTSGPCTCDLFASNYKINCARAQTYGLDCSGCACPLDRPPSPFGNKFINSNYAWNVNIAGPSPHNDKLLDSMVSTWVHEMYEAISDPQLSKYKGKAVATTSWYDLDDDHTGGPGPKFTAKGGNNEVGDLCANGAFGQSMAFAYNTNAPNFNGAPGPLMSADGTSATINANIKIGNAGYESTSPYYLIQAMYLYQPKDASGKDMGSQCVMAPSEAIDLGPPETYQFNFFNAWDDGSNGRNKYMLKVLIGNQAIIWTKPAVSGAVGYGEFVSFTKTVRGASGIQSMEIVKATDYGTVTTSYNPNMKGFPLDSSINNALIVLAVDPKGGLFTPVLGFGQPSKTMATWIGVNLQYNNPSYQADNNPVATFSLKNAAGTAVTTGVFNDGMTYYGMIPGAGFTQYDYYSFGTYQYPVPASDESPAKKKYTATLTSTIAGQAPVGPITLPLTCAVAGCISYTLFLPDGKQYNWPPVTTAGTSARGQGGLLVMGHSQLGDGSFAPVAEPTEAPVKMYQLQPTITWVYGNEGQDCVEACLSFAEMSCSKAGPWPKTQQEFQFYANAARDHDDNPMPVPNKVCKETGDGKKGRRLQDLPFGPPPSAGHDSWGQGGAPPADPFDGVYTQQFYPAFSYSMGFTDDCNDGTIFIGTGTGTCTAKHEAFTRYCPCKVDPKKTIPGGPKKGKPTAHPTKHHLRKMV